MQQEVCFCFSSSKKFTYYSYSKISHHIWVDSNEYLCRWINFLLARERLPLVLFKGILKREKLFLWERNLWKWSSFFSYFFFYEELLPIFWGREGDKILRITLAKEFRGCFNILHDNYEVENHIVICSSK